MMRWIHEMENAPCLAEVPLARHMTIWFEFGTDDDGPHILATELIAGAAECVPDSDGHFFCIFLALVHTTGL